MHDCHSCRWTCSCVANPEYVAADMRKAVRHAMESASYDSPFLCLLVLPRWDDTPWRSADILSHENIEILASLAPRQMRFTPADVPPELQPPPSPLPPAKWPVDFVLVANHAGRSRWLDIHKLQTIFVPALRQLCATPDQHIELFPNSHTPRAPPTNQVNQPTTAKSPTSSHPHARHHPHHPPAPCTTLGIRTRPFYSVDDTRRLIVHCT